jgi:endonuclease YncB( thermonuclease family)
MYDYFGKNKYFWAIIIAALIIGGAIYISNQRQEKNLAVSDVNKIKIPIAPQNLPQQTQIKADTTINKVVCGTSANTVVTKVIDGDTVVVEGGYHVRLLGMDSDEKNYP